MTTESTEELLVEGLQEMYYTENQLIDALGTLEEQTSDDAAKQGFSKHREETREHVNRLEKVFEQLDESPQEKEDMVVKAMIEEHEQFSGENEGEVLDRYNMEIGQKTEHLEIAAYGSLTSLAGKLGHDEAADVLEETLREEETALEEVTKASEQFDQQQVESE
ncbi:DUF892 family protein [Halorubellus sp. JP-L1]|uniref:YciE/YciF ferroxidase family protein n=1 Tax=Halorubellus sp. JP-L1 TaxID=2715753 RepID=UPI00140B2CF1|nr:DUF892 family protein [Halorubellus sp. JP-L1]NHN41161.1 DUF892 family protein [Halorubellus sp. JP-L1]